MHLYILYFSSCSLHKMHTGFKNLSYWNKKSETPHLSVVTHNPIHSNHNANYTNLSSRRSFVAITDEIHGIKKRKKIIFTILSENFLYRWCRIWNLPTWALITKRTLPFILLVRVASSSSLTYIRFIRDS